VGFISTRTGQRSRAFTLVELVAALVVMALATGLVVPAFEGGLRTRSVWRAARQFGGAIRHSRSRALVSGEIQVLIIDPMNGSYEGSALREPVSLDDDAEFVSVDGGSVVGGEIIRVLFYPNGGTSGLEVVVGMRDDPQGVRYLVTLDPLIGTVHLADAGT
jgi:general secretion pathway protein H